MNYVSQGLSYVHPGNLVTVVKPYLGLGKSPVPVVVQPPNFKEMLATLGNAGVFIKLAGISGAIAVGLGAYGSHTLLRRKEDPEKQPSVKETFKIANQYHFIHTLALLAVPFAGKPILVGSLLVAGMTIFCGCCYNYSLRGDETFKKITPYGGTLLIAAWLAFLL